MHRTKVLYILIFCLFSSDLFAQVSATRESQLLLEKYNKFLSISGLSKTLRAGSWEMKKRDSFPDIPGLNNKTLKLLMLQSASSYYSVTDFSKAIDSLGGQDSTSVLFKTLFSKLCDYTAADSEDMAIIIRFRNSKTSSILIYYDKSLKVISTLPATKGSGISEGPGNPDMNAYGGIISNVTAEAKLYAKIRTGLSNYLRKLPHKQPLQITFSPTANENMIRVEVKNLKGTVTPGYQEHLFVSIFLLSAKKGGVDITFLFTLNYASGIMGTAKEENFRDAVIDYYQQASAFGQKLKERIRIIVKP